MALNESCLEIYKGLFCYPKNSHLCYQKANQQLNNIKKIQRYNHHAVQTHL